MLAYGTLLVKEHFLEHQRIAVCCPLGSTDKSLTNFAYCGTLKVLLMLLEDSLLILIYGFAVSMSAAIFGTDDCQADAVVCDTGLAGSSRISFSFMPSILFLCCKSKYCIQTLYIMKKCSIHALSTYISTAVC